MRNSKWTMIYWDVKDKEMMAYVRFAPDFMDLEKSGFPHGISLGGGACFKTKEDAEKYADRLDLFFDAMLIESKL